MKAIIAEKKKYPMDSASTRSVFDNVSSSKVLDDRELRIMQGQIMRIRRSTNAGSAEFGSIFFLLQKKPMAITAKITTILEKTAIITFHTPQ